MRGLVRWFDPEAGYGIIRSDQGVDVLVQRDEIASRSHVLVAGQRVQFEMVFPAQGAEAAIVRPFGTTLPKADGQQLTHGRVHSFDNRIGRGVIRSDDGKEVTVRRQAIQKPEPKLEEGEEVEFDWLYATQRIEAINVKPLRSKRQSPAPTRSEVRNPKHAKDRAGEAKLRVFLCHSSSDKPRARQLAQQLRVLPVSPWLDEEQLLPGHDWQREIRTAITNSHIVLTCLSARSITKAGFVQREIGMALDIADEQPEGTIFVIPVRFEECAVPERLRRWQWVDYWDVASFSRLTASFRTKALELGLFWT